MSDEEYTAGEVEAEAPDAVPEAEEAPGEPRDSGWPYETCLAAGTHETEVSADGVCIFCRVKTVDGAPLAAQVAALWESDTAAALLMEGEIAAAAPLRFSGNLELDFETFEADPVEHVSDEGVPGDLIYANMDGQEHVSVSEMCGPFRPSVTFHKHGKLLSVKANDFLAADIWRDISSRLKNERMSNLQFFGATAESRVVPERKELQELWRWVEDGLEDHPYFTILQTYGVTASISPSLAGYMRREKKRVAIRSTPYPCYASSPDDISETIVPGMFLKAKQFEVTEENSFMNQFSSGERYMVKGLTEEGAVDVYTHKVAGRTLLAEDSPYWTFPKEQIQTWFEDSDKFVITENVRDRFPELVNNLDAQLDNLVIGEEGRLFDHSRQDAGCEVLKGNFLCSKEMRMGKTAEALAACELIGSKRRAWIGPAVATIDIPAEFQARGVQNFKEIVNISDLDHPASYHIMTFDFLKKNNDPLHKVRRGNTAKTWLRKVGEGKSIADCPHCDQPLERPIKVRAVDNRIIHVSWTLFNGYACRNPYCIWTEVNRGRDRTRKSGKQYFAPTPWHSAGDIKAITHQGGYIDWERKKHAECGDHVGRKRICPKCGVVDAAWTPAIYKRIKKNYNTVVIDEIHLTKEGSSKVSKAALDMRGKHHIGNSGTPMSNSLVDMFEQFMWLFHTKSQYFPYDRVHGKRAFKERFCENIRISRLGTDRSHYKTLPYARNPLDFWNFVAPLLVRRTRKDPVYLASLEKLKLKLPTETTLVMPVRMIAPQALLLSGSIDTFKEQFEDYCMELEEEGRSLNSHIVITMMSRMKTAATIPGFLNKPGFPPLYHGGDLDPRGTGGKGIALASLVPAKVMEGKKIVIMSQYIMMREKLIEQFAHLNPVVMPSGTVAKKREALNLFRNSPDRPLAIVGPKQVCMGVELNCADVLIVPDLMWEAGTQQQALMRLMGPTAYDRLVEMFILNSEHSMDEHVYNVFYGKIAGMEQALDKRVITRSAQSVDWVAFADTVVAQQAALASYFRDSSDETEGIEMPEFGDDYFDQGRVA